MQLQVGRQLSMHQRCISAVLRCCSYPGACVLLQVRSRPINSAAAPAIINTYLYSSNASAPVLRAVYANVTGLSAGVGYQVRTIMSIHVGEGKGGVSVCWPASQVAINA